MVDFHYQSRQLSTLRIYRQYMPPGVLLQMTLQRPVMSHLPLIKSSPCCIRSFELDELLWAVLPLFDCGCVDALPSAK